MLVLLFCWYSPLLHVAQGGREGERDVRLILDDALPRLFIIGATAAAMVLVIAMVIQTTLTNWKRSKPILKRSLMAGRTNWPRLVT